MVRFKEIKKVLGAKAVLLVLALASVGFPQNPNRAESLLTDDELSTEADPNRAEDKKTGIKLL